MLRPASRPRECRVAGDASFGFATPAGFGRDVEPECRRGVALASGMALWARRKCNCPRPEDTPGYVRARVRHHSWPHPWHGTNPVKTLGRNDLQGLPYAKRHGYTSECAEDASTAAGYLIPPARHVGTGAWPAPYGSADHS